jgi:hypothetical protein
MGLKSVKVLETESYRCADCKYVTVRMRARHRDQSAQAERQKEQYILHRLPDAESGSVLTGSS